MVCRCIGAVSVLFLSACGVVVVTGCGGGTDGRVAVSGNVTLNGQPLNTGAIEFTSEDKSVVSGATISNGAYTVPAEQGLKPGSYTVRITSIQESGAVDPNAMPGPEAETHIAKDQIPAEWNQKREKVEVTAAGPNTFNFEIP